jgi:hypothetical protein
MDLGKLKAVANGLMGAEEAKLGRAFSPGEKAAFRKGFFAGGHFELTRIIADKDYTASLGGRPKT